MSKSIQTVRGMHDILPDESHRWQFFEEVVRNVMRSYGYNEIRTPLLESTDLFCRSIGEVTDIVEKEMYTFEDRNGDMLTLRPEGTASCVRSGIENGFLHNQVQRLWYAGPMFRHERPQKGRYRQFHQFGVEAFGMSGADIDAELILISARLWKLLGLNDLRLEINTLGSQQARADYRKLLVEYFEDNREALDDDSLRRLSTNPLRILDTKNKDMKSLVAGAPSLLDHIDAESAEHFEQLKSYLDESGIKYEVNPRLVRGLDYYCRTVFEWITDELGAQGTVCAGGRYDGLVKQLGGKEMPATGFALGVERLLALMESDETIDNQNQLDIYIVLQGEESTRTGLKLAEMIRDKISGISIQTDCSGGSFKSQLKKADKSNAGLALILGENEINQNAVTVKYLRDKRQQELVSMVDIEEFINKIAVRQ